MAHDVFISYSAVDKSAADAACAIMEGQGIRCWIAPRDIQPGADWAESIVDAIGASRAMVLIFSSASNRSPQVKKEVERAVHHSVAIIPVRIEDVIPSKALEYFLSTPHWMDAITSPLEAHLNRLAAVIKSFLADPATSGPSNKIPAASVGAGQNVISVEKRTQPRVLRRMAVLIGLCLIALVVIAAVIRNTGHTDIAHGPSQSNALCREAKTLFDAGKFDDAVRVYSSALELEPHSAAALLGRAMARHEACDWDGSIADCDQVLQIHPEALALVYRGMSHGGRSELDAAIEGCSAAIQKDPSCTLAYVGRGFAFARKGDLDNAMADADAALKITPGHARALSLRGSILDLKHDLKESLANCNEAVRRDPKLAMAYTCRAWVYLDMNQYENVVSDATEAIRLRPRLTAGYALRAAAHAMTGHYAEALADCNEAIRLNTNDADAYATRGYVFLKQNQPERALSDGTQAVRLNPRSAWGSLIRYTAFNELGQFDSAVSEATVAISRDATEPEPYYGRAIAYSKKKEWGLAIGDLDSYLRLCPDDAGAFAWRGMVYLRNGNSDSAAADFSRAGALDPSNLEFKQYRLIAADPSAHSSDILEAIPLPIPPLVKVKPLLLGPTLDSADDRKVNAVMAQFENHLKAYQFKAAADDIRALKGMQALSRQTKQEIESGEARLVKARAMYKATHAQDGL